MIPSTTTTSTAGTSRQAEINFRLLVLDIAWFGLALPSTARFLSLYAIRVNASASMLGWMASLPAMVALVTSGLSAWWGKRFSNIVTAQLWPGVGFRLVFLLPAFAPFFPYKWQPLWLVAALSIAAIPQGISSVLFLVLMRQGIEKHRLTALLSQRALAINITVGIMTLVFGFWLEKAPFPHNYQAMFVVAFIFSLASLVCVQRVRVITPEPAPSVDHPPLRPWRSPIFRRVAFVNMIANVAFFSLTAVIPLRLVDGLGADEVFMSVYAVAELSAAALASALTSRLMRRIGTLPTIALGMIGTGFSGIVLAAAPDKYYTLFGAALSGSFWTVATIALFAYFSENTPAESATRYTTVYNQVIMLSIFIGPMIGSQLASASIKLVTVLALGAAARLVVGGMIAFNSLRPSRPESEPGA